jgi:hypothetical protein
MFAVAHLLLIGVLAYQLQCRVGLLKDFTGLPRYLFSLGLTLFLVNWADFLLYALLGWGVLYQLLSWGALLSALLYGALTTQPAAFRPPLTKGLLAFREWDWWFLFLAGFVLIRFYKGLYADQEGQVWNNFNFVDTAFHLSVVNAFLEAPRFPPMDLDMAPYPMKYHFIADFYVAHLARLGLPALGAMWLMNLVSAAVLVGSLWAAFARWLKLPPRWVLLAGLIFLFLNPALLNLIHYLGLHPAFFKPAVLFDGILAYPYFNFEFSLYNLIEPQRGLLFSLPVVLLILHAAFGGEDVPPAGPPAAARTLQAFLLICLLPLAHIVAFAVLALSLVPKLWQHRTWFLARYLWWAPVFVLGVLQLLYLQSYGPPTNAQFSSWDVASALPLQEFSAFPGITRRMLFWFFIDGDFLFWGGLFAGLALVQRARGGEAAAGSAPLRKFAAQWRWYFAAAGFFFLLINVYRYSFAWGDSNKFVLFLNLGLALVITLGAAQWLGRRRQILSQVLWWFFFGLCLAAPSYDFYQWVFVSPHGKILLFVKNERLAAEWLGTVRPRSSIVLTAAYQTYHFVTPLAGLPTLAGIYADSNPYRQDAREADIRRIYEQADFGLLAKLQVRYVCISNSERRTYQLSPVWAELGKSGRAVVFQAGGPEDSYSVFIFDAAQLAGR